VVCRGDAFADTDATPFAVMQATLTAVDDRSASGTDGASRRAPGRGRAAGVACHDRGMAEGVA
jgi:hypothetical protein